MAYQLAAPWYTREYNSTKVDDSLAKLYEANGGDSIIFPETPLSYVSIGGTNYKYNQKEYENAKKTVGRLSYSGVESAFDYKPSLLYIMLDHDSIFPCSEPVPEQTESVYDVHRLSVVCDADEAHTVMQRFGIRGKIYLTIERMDEKEVV